MTALWENDGTEWQLIAPAGFGDEAALHTLVDEAPQMLPLSGAPDLIVVGREVQLGGGYADLLAVETSGRPVVIEVKLSRNAEARRAVVAQALAYAAYLNELDAEAFEEDVLRGHLRSRGWSSLETAVAEADQQSVFDPATFRAGLESSFDTGSFRLVFVLDEAPTELVRLVGYLESVSDRLVIDLVTVTAYEIGGSKILVPQRVDPERTPKESQRQPVRAKVVSGERSTSGPDAFEKSVERSPAENQESLRRLLMWATRIESAGFATLTSFDGQNRQILLPRLLQDNVGLVTLWNDNGAAIQFWRSVWERRAPETLVRLEQLVSPDAVRQGNTTRRISDELLAVLFDGYSEAHAARRSGFDWSRVRSAVEAIPDGKWTTYGDLAELAGTAAIAVGRYVASEPNLAGAHRVMGADGKPRPDFRWIDPSDTRDVLDVLRAEGVPFSPNGVANESARLRGTELEALLESSVVR